MRQAGLHSGSNSHFHQDRRLCNFNPAPIPARGQSYKLQITVPLERENEDHHKYDGFFIIVPVMMAMQTKHPGVGKRKAHLGVERDKRGSIG